MIMKRISTFKLVFCGIFSALATVAFIIESLFPPLFLPGARMGVSNIFILLSALTLGSVYGFITLFVKVTLGSLLSGNVFSIVYSLPSGMIALAVELLILNFCNQVSIVCISVFGAVLNITVQNATFCLITKTTEYLYYLPYLSLMGIIGGLIVGFAVYLIIKILPNKLFSKIYNENEQEKKLEH